MPLLLAAAAVVVVVVRTLTETTSSSPCRLRRSRCCWTATVTDQFEEISHRASDTSTDIVLMHIAVERTNGTMKHALSPNSALGVSPPFLSVGQHNAARARTCS